MSLKFLRFKRILNVAVNFEIKGCFGRISLNSEISRFRFLQNKTLNIIILIMLSFNSANAGLSFMTLMDSLNSVLKLAHVLSYLKTMYF
jgi:hypothetical protein